MKIFFFEQLSIFALKNQTVREYMIYRGFEKSELVLKLLDSNNYFHRREYQRILASFKEFNQSGEEHPRLVIMNVGKITNYGIADSIKNFMKYSIMFWK